MLGTRKGELAVVAPQFKKIEAEIVGGLARISQRVELQEVALVGEYKFGDVQLTPGDKVLVAGDAGLAQWAKKEFRLSDGTTFVLCPESQVIGYIKKQIGYPLSEPRKGN